RRGIRNAPRRLGRLKAPLGRFQIGGQRVEERLERLRLAAARKDGVQIPHEAEGVLHADSPLTMVWGRSGLRTGTISKVSCSAAKATSAPRPSAVKLRPWAQVATRWATSLSNRSYSPTAANAASLRSKRPPPP